MDPLKKTKNSLILFLKGMSKELLFVFCLFVCLFACFYVHICTYLNCVCECMPQVVFVILDLDSYFNLGSL